MGTHTSSRSLSTNYVPGTCQHPLLSSRLSCGDTTLIPILQMDESSEAQRGLVTYRVTQLCKWWSWDSNPDCLSPKPELFPPLHAVPLTFWDVTVGTWDSEHKVAEAESLGGHQLQRGWGRPGVLLALQTLGTKPSCLLLMDLWVGSPPTAAEAWPPARHSTAHTAEWGSCD